MTVQQAQHAQKVVNRFSEMIGPELTEQLTEEHMAELALLIEAAIDASILETEDNVINKLNDLTTSLRRDADTFTS